MATSVDPKLFVTNPEQWLEETAHGPELMCLVIFRGSWCKYDKYFLQKLGEYHQKVLKSDNVKIFAWTSEGEEGAAKADAEWGLTKTYGFEAVLGDDTLALAKWLVEDEVLPDLVTTTPQELGVTVPENSHKNGVVLPGIIWYAHHGNMVFQWVAKSPGGPGRPDPESMYEIVVKRKHALDHGNAVMPSHGTDVKLCATDMDITMANCIVT